MAQEFIIAGVRKLNEFKVIQLVLTLLESKDYGDGELTEQKRRNEPSPMERESHTLLIEGHSTQGITIKQMIGGSIHVELPWLASFMDVELCYAYLNAVLQVHRAARILDEHERAALLTDEAAREAWKQRLYNMGEILERGERQVVTGVNRDFHIAPSRYKDKKGAADPWIAFYYFEWLQWDYLEVRDAMEERRHLSDDEELSTLRVVDNTERLFIGACRYVGMLRDNICKIMPYDEFRRLVEKENAFQAMDAAQGIFNKMDEERWQALFDSAGGIVREHFRKTFIMRWNTDISNYKMWELDETMADLGEGSMLSGLDKEPFYYDWSIWDHAKAHVGDRFYMIRTGEGRKGVVMRGTLIGTPYPDEDWSGKGRKVYYIRMRLSHMIHPEKAPLLLSTETLAEQIPDFDWEQGHSGMMLTDRQADKLEEVWRDYAAQGFATCTS